MSKGLPGRCTIGAPFTLVQATSLGPRLSGPEAKERKRKLAEQRVCAGLMIATPGTRKKAKDENDERGADLDTDRFLDSSARI